jgi:RNA polymerase sigma-70 factor (ECF subfamily)
MSAAKTPDEAADSTHGAKGGGFPATMWTWLLEIQEADEETRRAALDFLIRRYWKPVYLFIRREGHAEEEAKDLAQAFFTVALIRNLFGRANPEIGRFRNFLLKSLKRFLANARRDAHAKKRQPEHGFVSIHELSSQEQETAPH